MEIIRVGSVPSGRSPANRSSGTVRRDPLFEARPPSNVAASTVTFEPGARTAWHTHPRGQSLIILSGCGWIQVWGKPIEEVYPGDVICFSPHEKHWHGATVTTAMAHIAITEDLNGETTDWMEHVSDAQYLSRTNHRP